MVNSVSRDGTTQVTSAQGECPSQLFITTNPGMEDVVRDELLERLRAAGLPPVAIELNPFGFGGQVWVEGGEAERMCQIAMELRSIHHVFQPLHRFSLPPQGALQHIESEVEVLGIAAMETAKTFRVTSRRSGEHDFGSVDVQRRAGAALWRHYGTAVDLENPDVEVRVDVFGCMCLVSFQRTLKSLSKRFVRRYQPRVALKASVAYALLHFARIGEKSDGTLLDPFCGSGTILFEAAEIFPDLALFGSDIDQHVVDCARENASALGCAGRMALCQGDARGLDAVFPDRRFNYIVTNPPYGMRFGQHLNFDRFYTRVLQQCWYRLRPGGRLVLIAWKYRLFSRAAKRTGLFCLRAERVVETGGLHPRIFALDRIDREGEN